MILAVTADPLPSTGRTAFDKDAIYGNTAERMKTISLKQEPSDFVVTVPLDPTPEQEALLNRMFEEAGEDSILFAPTDDPQEFVRVGRNDPCPCGSGRKFKKCCFTQ